MLRKFPKLPIPLPFPSPLVDIIIEVGKKLLDKAMNSKIGEEIAKKDKYDEDNINDVIYYNKLLNELINEINNDVNKIEEKIVLECTEYYDELIILIEAVEQSKNINLHSKFVKRHIEKLKKDINGGLIKNIHRKIELNNIDLKKLLSLSAGELKKERIQCFKENLIKQVLNEFVNEIDLLTKELGEEVSEDLNEVISEIRKNNEVILKQLDLLEKSQDNNENDINDLLETGKMKILLCDEILNEVME